MVKSHSTFSGIHDGFNQGRSNKFSRWGDVQDLHFTEKSGQGSHDRRRISVYRRECYEYFIACR